MIATGHVEIDVKKIPDVAFRPLARAIYEAAEAYFKVPENVAAFEAWREEYRRKKAEREEQQNAGI